jgi:hypothetical protein
MAEGRDQARQSRLRAALRENLKRRKQQLRGRADQGAPPDDEPAPVPDKGDGCTGDRNDRE